MKTFIRISIPVYGKIEIFLGSVSKKKQGLESLGSIELFDENGVSLTLVDEETNKKILTNDYSVCGEAIFRLNLQPAGFSMATILQQIITRIENLKDQERAIEWKYYSSLPFRDEEQKEFDTVTSLIRKKEIRNFSQLCIIENELSYLFGILSKTRGHYSLKSLSINENRKDLLQQIEKEKDDIFEVSNMLFPFLWLSKCSGLLSLVVNPGWADKLMHEQE